MLYLANKDVLVLAGHESLEDRTYLCTIKRTDLKDLGIIFNHCVRNIDDLNVSIEITDDKGRNILIKTFRVNLGKRMDN